MPVDPEILAANERSTERIRAMAEHLTEDAMRHPVGEHWTVAITLAHLAFWDRRALDSLRRSVAANAPTAADVDIVVNDLSLPLWAAIPPSDAVLLALDAASEIDSVHRDAGGAARRRCSSTPIRAGSGATSTGTSTSTRPRRSSGAARPADRSGDDRMRRRRVLPSSSWRRSSSCGSEADGRLARQPGSTDGDAGGSVGGSGVGVGGAVGGGVGGVGAAWAAGVGPASGSPWGQAWRPAPRARACPWAPAWVSAAAWVWVSATGAAEAAAPRGASRGSARRTRPTARRDRRRTRSRSSCRPRAASPRRGGRARCSAR